MYKQIIGKRDLLEKTSDYPFIVVHGFLGYGEETLFSKVFPYFGFRRYGGLRKSPFGKVRSPALRSHL